MARHDLGPLFEAPRLRELSHASDPHTSVKAAARAVRQGVVQGDTAILLDMIHSRPGLTMAEYGAQAAFEAGPAGGLDAYQWRLKLGRRTGPLLERRLVHTEGERDGMALWWPGRRPSEGR